MFMTLYVNNILMVSNDLEMVAATKDWLLSNFGMKDMGDANYVLRVKIYKNRSKSVFCFFARYVPEEHFRKI